jgi:target of rapamycin complex 2 subunit MAPKAP1
LIHGLRLGYLRNVEDPYGRRLISFNPSFSANPYINAASLADLNKWPELVTPPSPPLSPDESDGPTHPGSTVSGFPGATGLNYTPTILGPSRTGALGMSVNGRRRASRLQQTVVIVPPAQDDASSKSPQEQARVAAAAPTAAADLPTLKIYVPNFRGAAEMDERRRLRMQMRRGVAADAAAAGGAAPGTRVVQVASPGKGAALELLSSEEEEDSFSPEDDEDFDDVVDVGVSVDIDEDEDEFDP